jgi:hypothetical protein
MLGLLAVSAPARAQDGHDHMAIWSTEPGGGELTADWDFAGKKVQLFRSFCAGGECFYSTINPAFLAPEADENLEDDFHVLNDGTQLGIEIIAADAAVTLNVNGIRLRRPGESARLGITPGVHVHPSWQVQAPENEHGDYQLSFKLTTTTLPYRESQPFTSVLTNVAAPTVAPTPTPTPRPDARCTGDCDGDDEVAIEELVLGMKMVMVGNGPGVCPAFDADGDGKVTIDEMMRAVSAALHGCLRTPTPTRPPASLQQIQDQIFTPKCAIASCHAAPSGVNDLVLSEGFAYDELVGVEPFVDAARRAGLLRVDPGRPENSFLLIKLTGPPPDQGSRMPLSPAPALTQAEIDLVGDWILQGAPR